MVPLTARPGVLVPVSGVSVVRGAALVGGFDGGWHDWGVAAVGGCRLLVRLSLSVFRLVLVMVSLVVQMVGGTRTLGSPWRSVDGGAFGGVRVSGIMVSALLWLVPFVRAVWFLRQGSVALVTVVCWGSAPVVAVRW